MNLEWMVLVSVLRNLLSFTQSHDMDVGMEVEVKRYLLRFRLSQSRYHVNAQRRRIIDK